MASTEMITITREEFEEYNHLKSEVAWLKYQLAELKRLIFGAKSERYIAPDPNQPTLFELPEELTAEKPQQEITYKRSTPETKKHPLRRKRPGASMFFLRPPGFIFAQAEVCAVG
jgi:hypothetical protein